MHGKNKHLNGRWAKELNWYNTIDIRFIKVVKLYPLFKSLFCPANRFILHIMLFKQIDLAWIIPS